jgi:hypothetical protein
MSLDPTVSASWNSLFDAMRPPAGYTLLSAAGTTYGLSLETVMASLIAMEGADAEQLASNPVAGVLSVTRLASRVRIFYQDGRCQVPSNAFPSSLATLLERVVVPVSLSHGEFHPKMWVLQFVDVLTPSETLIRLVVSSRNLAQSRSLEAGIVLEGKPGSRPNPLGTEVARGIKFCLKSSRSQCRPLIELVNALRNTSFEKPHEADDLLEIYWQDSQSRSLSAKLPRSAERVVIASPFLSPSFIKRVMPRFAHVTVVTTAETLNQLDDTTFGILETACEEERLYIVDEISEAAEADDAGYLDGIHAKILVMDNGKGSLGSTFIGSANATGQGWSLGGPFNIEATAHLQPGLGYQRFLDTFIHASKTQLKPWIKEFKREDRTPIREEVVILDWLKNGLADLAAATLVVRYERENRTLTVTCESSIRGTLSYFPPESNIELLPYGFVDERPDWRSVELLIDGGVKFDNTDLRNVSAFIIIRATCAGVMVRSLAFAQLLLSDEVNAERYQAVREGILSMIPRDELLAALVLGDYRWATPRSHERGESAYVTAVQGPTLNKVSLEQMLQTLAANPELMREVQILLGNGNDIPFNRFCDDLKAALKGANVI